MINNMEVDMDNCSENKRIVTTFWKEIWNSRNFSVLGSLVENEYSVTSLSNPGKGINSRDKIIANVQRMWKKLDKFKLVLNELYCENSKVISVIQLSGIDENGQLMMLDEMVIHTLYKKRLRHALSINTGWKIVDENQIL